MRDHIVQNLVTTVINDGDGTQCGYSYRSRCHLADSGGDGARHTFAKSWLHAVSTTDIWCYEHIEDYERATVSEMLAAASSLAEYYLIHQAEGQAAREQHILESTTA